MIQRVVLSGFLILSMTVALAYAGPITLYTNQAAFEAATGAIEVPIPNSDCFSQTCGTPVAQTGQGMAVSMFFGSDLLTVTSALGNSICIFDEGSFIDNTVPSLMIGNTIAANFDDDYLFTFTRPVYAVGFRLITNNVAAETVTFKDSADTTIEVKSLDAYTVPNTRHFFGFASSVPFSSLVIDTSGGAVQNEAIDLLEVGAQPVPDPGWTLLLFGMGLAGLRAWRKRWQ